MACLLNTFFGTAPLWIPNLLLTRTQWFPQLPHSNIIFSALILTLAIIQFIIAHVMHGSPGKCVTSIEVKRFDGRYPSFLQSFLRSLPYFAFSAAVVMARQLPIVSVTIFALSVSFLISNGLFVLLGRSRLSIMDIWVGTIVVSIGPGWWTPKEKYR